MLLRLLKLGEKSICQAGQKRLSLTTGFYLWVCSDKCKNYIYYYKVFS